MLLRPGERGAENPEWARVEGDICDEAAMDALIARLRPDLVVHLAGQASIGQATQDAAQTWRANLVGTFNLAAAIGRHAPQATVLFSSSATIYGAAMREGPVSETTPPQPLDAYSRSKLAAELALDDMLPATARLIIGRPVNHSGAGQRSNALCWRPLRRRSRRSRRGGPSLRCGSEI